MNILITGANGSLGEKLKLDLESLSFKVLCASSNPGVGQINFDLKNGFESNLLENIDLILHLAIHPKLVITDIEKNFVHLAAAKDITLIYIGSTSSYLVKPNQYGKYKKKVEDLVIENKGIVLTCGLLYGSNFKGQLSKIKKFLRILPFNIQVSGSKLVYTTPIQAIIDFVLRPTDNQVYRGKRLLMSQFEAIPFNLLLLKLAGNRIFKITFSSKTIDLIIKLNPFKTRYFSSDRYVALFSDFKSELILNSVDLRKEIGEKYDFNDF